MSALKNTLNGSLTGIAGILPFGLLKKAAGGRLIAPFYHAVSDQPMPHIRHLYRVKTLKEFECDLDFLLKHYRPVDFHELPQILSKKVRYGEKPPMLLSFDDGLREFYDPIAPMLLRKGIPAICFLNSAFLDNKGLFFRYKASLLIETLGNRCDENLRKKILSIRYDDQAELDAMATKTGLDFNEFLRQHQPYLTTEQLETLLKQGFHFGAHSMDHPEYRFLNPEEQLRQTTKSVEQISNRFGLGYRLFSFPFTDYGVPRAFFDFILEEKKVAEYTFGTAGLKTDVDPRHIQRIPLESGSDSAEQVLRREFLYFWLKMPFGKNRIRRT